MTTHYKTKEQCKNCGKRSEHEALMSTHALGSPDLDFRPSEMQRSTMDTWLQLCPHCGYCAPDISQGAVNPAVLQSEPYRSALGRKDFPELARRFLAYAVALDSSEPAAVAKAFLQAAWLCDDAGQGVQALECRHRAVEWFRKCKPFEDNEQSLATGVIMVDVLRRSGLFAEASSECAALLTAYDSIGLFRNVLEYQHRLIAHSDQDAHLLSDSEVEK